MRESIGRRSRGLIEPKFKTNGESLNLHYGAAGILIILFGVGVSVWIAKAIRNHFVPVRVQAACFRALARVGIHVHPRDAELVESFDRNRGALETIRTMLYDDSRLAYVGHLHTWAFGEDQARTPENAGISPERWDLYRQLMREAGVQAVSRLGNTITIQVSTFGSSSKGFTYSPAHRVVVSSLERYPLPPELHAHLILDEPWYVYYGWQT